MRCSLCDHPMDKIGPPRRRGRDAISWTMAQLWRCSYHPDADELELEIHRILSEPLHKLTTTLTVEE